MRVVNMHEAKTSLSRLVEAVEKGEEIVLARHGRPVARLVAFKRAVPGRRLGVAEGLIGDLVVDNELDASVRALFETERQ